jgi:hypothetical protein
LKINSFKAENEYIAFTELDTFTLSITVSEYPLKITLGSFEDDIVKEYGIELQSMGGYDSDFIEVLPLGENKFICLTKVDTAGTLFFTMNTVYDGFSVIISGASEGRCLTETEVEFMAGIAATLTKGGN